MQVRSAENDPALWTAGERGWLVALTLVALLLRLLLAARAAVIEPDGAFYARLAQDALRGTGSGGFHPAWPPGYPGLVALAAQFIGLVGGAGVAADSPPIVELAARSVSALAGALLVPVVVLLARRTIGPRAAWVAGLLVLAHPNLVDPSTQALTEMTFALTLALCLLLLGPTAGLARVGLAGLAAGGAFLLRPEGLILAAGLTAALMLGGVVERTPRPTRVRGALLFAVLAALVTVPHVARVSRHQGQLSLGAKSDYNLALAYAGHPGVPTIVRSRSEYNNLPGATPPAGFPEPIPAFRLLPFLAREPVTVARHLLGELPRAAGALPSLATLPLLALALAGAWSRRRTATAEERTWLLLWLAWVGLYALVFVYRRFFTVFLPLLLISAAVPLTPTQGGSAFRRGLALAALTVLLLWGALHSVNRLGRAPEGFEQRRLGEELRRSVRAGAMPDGGVAARKPTLAWYAGLPILAIPEGDSAAILAAAAARGAEYLVLDALDLGRERPELRSWIESGAQAPVGWTEVAHSGEGRERVRLLRRQPGD